MTDLPHRLASLSPAVLELLRHRGDIVGEAVRSAIGEALELTGQKISHEPATDSSARNGSVRISVDERGMNKTEAAYARYLDLRIEAGEVRDYWFEVLKVRLADRTWFMADFAVRMSNGELEMHEVKGPYIREDAIVKFKVARKLHPWATWRMMQRDNHQWRQIR